MCFKMKKPANLEESHGLLLIFFTSALAGDHSTNNRHGNMRNADIFVVAMCVIHMVNYNNNILCCY